MLSIVRQGSRQFLPLLKTSSYNVIRDYHIDFHNNDDHKKIIKDNIIGVHNLYTLKHYDNNIDLLLCDLKNKVVALESANQIKIEQYDNLRKTDFRRLIPYVSGGVLGLAAASFLFGYTAFTALNVVCSSSLLFLLFSEMGVYGSVYKTVIIKENYNINTMDPDYKNFKRVVLNENNLNP
ncbi:MAG: hypothetical protein Homavirus43_4 [Homavirus sp.]|uniref:Uncharacterized protein n=1 Tax=Homavirus sp. TaxID=2487769 RepID=A0A3G5A5U4_9VIRU|nr:MAG: hypothetical protein Homavirus43_4 [Homavirus sp.]